MCGLANLQQFACIAYLCACDTKHCIAYYVLTHCITIEKLTPRQLSYEMCQGYIYSCFQALVVKKRVWYTLLTRAQSYFDHLHTLLYYGQFQFTAEGHTSDGNLPNSELGVHKQCIPDCLSLPMHENL